jgi:hypothetical protein
MFKVRKLPARRHGRIKTHSLAHLAEWPKRGTGRSTVLRYYGIVTFPPTHEKYADAIADQDLSFREQFYLLCNISPPVSIDVKLRGY